MIKASDLVAKFKYALDNKWGYIWGKSGQVWTQRDQANASREMTVKYGAKWIGHVVADCSGLFRWAYKQFGLEIAHGSNLIYNGHCKARGRFAKGKRSDGEELKVGTALFTGTDGDRGHIGLYIGGGKVIEAAGTQQGVIMSESSAGKWTWWGELTLVDYDQDEGGGGSVQEGYAKVTGKRVALREAPSTRATIITRVNTGEIVRLAEEPPKEWDYVEYNGKKGYMMREFLQEG